MKITRHEKTLDLTDKPNPLPVLLAFRELKQLYPGQTLSVLASGRQTAIDFHDFAKLTGHPLHTSPHDGDIREYVIQKR